MNGQYFGYIAAAYGITGFVVGATVLRIVLEYRRLRGELARFETRGFSERGDP